MTIEELVSKLEGCQHGDTEGAHIEADTVLLEYINDERVTTAFSNIRKWYA